MSNATKKVSPKSLKEDDQDSVKKAIRLVSIIPPQVPQTGIDKTPKAPPLWGILRRDWRNRARYSNEIVIGGAQRRRQVNSISRRIRGEEKIKNVGRVSKAVQNTR
ncbi:hypothetical protein E2C01_035254 [Portunus trituberculatus]|uniref:Uncharacterized protein n=1 Tax=Portunus trituberculatus TaxID=210409 RepID=A0A5B7FAZ8_PORTR|nr:hypothetical protein [Portunus trituberculatus]